jgi:hypothetical protein
MSAKKFCERLHWFDVRAENLKAAKIVSTNVSDSREPDFAGLEPYVAKVLDLLMPRKKLP